MVRKKRTSRISRPVSVQADLTKKINHISRLVERIEEQQKRLLSFQHKELNKLEESEERLEEDIVEAEAGLAPLNEKEELNEIKRLEQSLKQGAQPSPLRRITYKDITKGIVGAFIAVVNQFAFADGFLIARNYTVAHASLLYLTSFLIIVLFIYYTGFRKVDDRIVFRVLPLRASVLYFTAIAVSLAVPFLFGTLTAGMPFSVIYSTVASISVLAVLGAGTADLIGKA